MKKVGWLIGVIILSGSIYFGYSTYLNPKPQPIDIPKEQRFFQDDGTSLDWLQEPEQASGDSQEEEIQQETTIINDEKMDESTIVLGSEDNLPEKNGNQQVEGVTKGHDKNPGTQSISKKDPVQEIKSRYTAKFKSLEKTYQGKLKGLIGQAKQDYIAMKKGEVETSTASLAGKYLKKANQMEGQADSQFYQVLAQMEGELKSKGLPTDMIEIAEAEYKQRKRNQRAALFQEFSI